MTRQYQTSASSRERNRIHARKTRQRKKEQMQLLTNKADELKKEQIHLKQTINEKNTASILVGLFASNESVGEQRSEDPRVEALLKRPADEIPDAAKLPELPALILPGQHNSKKLKASTLAASQQEFPDDGIDYELLGKDRSKCTPAELDQIRRERNRMHAKRTRDRKRLFMEEMAEMCKKLEEENLILQRHLDGLNGFSSTPSRATSVVSPALSASHPQATPSQFSIQSKPNASSNTSLSTAQPVSEHGVTVDQIKTLLEAASTFSAVMSTSAVSASTNGSEGSDTEQDHHSSFKRRRLSTSDGVTSVPNSITTSTPTAVGC